MSIQPLVDLERPPVAPESAKGNPAKVTGQQHTEPQTPPGSSSGSPRVEPQVVSSQSSQTWAPLPPVRQLDPTFNASSILPSLGEFDQGVENLARAHAAANPRSPPSPLPSFSQSSPLPSLAQTGHAFQPVTPSGSSWSTRERQYEDSAPEFYSSRRGTMTGSSQSGAVLQPTSPSESSWSTRDQRFDSPASEFCSSRRGTLASLSQYALAFDKAHQLPQSPMASSPVAFNTINYHWHGSPTPRPRNVVDSYPSPPPEGENRHINQKYTTEEGDFIIYAWHDRKMKWQRIKKEFADRFGRTPERTVQGLQAWYYRMNQRIPVWDKNGWLCFDDDDSMEPRQISIKCRERDSHDKPMEPLGLAQRYPERAVLYSWVDSETKNQARDWAAKRASQFESRRERRRRKEQRRLKL